MADRQRATAMYFIDRLALRAGNEKGEDEALEVFVAEGGDVAAKLGPHLFDVESGDGEVVGGVDVEVFLAEFADEAN